MFYKSKKVTCLIIFLITIIFIVSSENVNAAYFAVERGTETGSVSMSLGNVTSGNEEMETVFFNYKYIVEKNSISEISVSDYRLDNNKAAYCLDMTADTPASGNQEMYINTTKYSIEQRKMINAIIRSSSEVINKVPDSFITDSDAVGFNTSKTVEQIRLSDYRYYCAQIAINVYLGVKSLNIGASNQVALYAWDKDNNQTINDIKSLISTARSRIEAESAAFSITTDIEEPYMTIDDDNVEGDYFVSELVKLNESFSQYTVTVQSFDGKNDVNKIKVVDSNGKEKELFKTGEGFKIMIPADEIVNGGSTFKVIIDAKNDYTEYKEAVIYTANNTQYQALAEQGEISKQEKSASTYFRVALNKDNYVKVSKLDVTRKKELPGATLQILDENKEKISCIIVGENGNDKTLDNCSWVSTDKPVLIKNLPVGKYYLIETQAPEGYVLSKEEIEFIVDEKNYIVPVEMYNELEVEVPDTLSGKSALLLTIAMLDIAVGIGIVTYVKKNKVQE